MERSLTIPGLRDWIGVLPQKEAASLATVRLIPKLQLALWEEAYWLKMPWPEDDLPLAVRSLPFRQTFGMDQEGRLFPPKGISPVGRIPELEWQEIADFVQVQVPVSALPGTVNEQLPVRLIPAQNTYPAYALGTDWQTWREYVARTPSIRWQHSQYARSSNDQILVLGPPLPALPGQVYWQEGPLLIPAGWDWEFPLLSELISTGLQLLPGDWALFAPDNTYQLIRQAEWVTTSLASIRVGKK